LVTAAQRFEQWFTAKFGKRPATKLESSRLQDTMLQGLRAEQTLRQCAIWDEQHKAAAECWLVTERQKQGRGR
jgi:hypothetical protein